jgi:cytochrome c-type biogenesis protein CcmH/NrfG
MSEGVERMKKILASALLVFAIAACQKEEPKSDFKVPAGPGPTQVQDEIRILREAVRNDPGNADAWINLGNFLMDASQFNDAIDAYQKALDIDPKNVNVRVDMGICYRNTGRPDIAVKEFRKSVEIDPKHINAHKNLAIVLAYDMKDSAGAIKEFEKSIQLDPNASDVPRMKMEIEKLQAAK